jgi:cytidine deaminase
VPIWKNGGKLTNANLIARYVEPQMNQVATGKPNRQRKSLPEPKSGPRAEQLQALFAAARAVREQADAPYSKFRVSAAVLDAEGRVHAGANVKVAAYPQG